jgi:arylsulfatase A-like enzyme
VKRKIIMMLGRLSSSVLCVLPCLSLVSCSGESADSLPLQSASPLKLQEHLDAATVTGSQLPRDLPQPVEWHFDQPQPEWTPFANPGTHPFLPMQAAEVSREADALRLSVDERSRTLNGRQLIGTLLTAVPDWDAADWPVVVVRARTSDPGQTMFLLGEFGPQLGPLAQAPLHGDGQVQTYRLELPQSAGQIPPLERIGLALSSQAPGSVDILSVSARPAEVEYGQASTGVRSVAKGDEIREAIYVHAPARLSFPVRLAGEANLAFAVGSVRAGDTLRFRVALEIPGQEPRVLLEQTATDRDRWLELSAAIEDAAPVSASLILETDANRPGAVGLWGAPIVSERRDASAPDIIFYVIDGAGADWMSLYGYNRRTTPFLERLAEEAVVFENAYSNATSTPVSTPSYMTSLLYSALDRYRSYFDKIPDGVTTMAEHFERAGHQTGVFVSNPFASTAKGLERSVDFVRVMEPPVPAVSSEHLHRAFWDWRKRYPGAPYWAHFQTTDVHEPFRPMAPFSGLFITPELRASYIEWDQAVRWSDTASYAAAGITVEQHALAQQALYDEGMAHQDHHLKRFVRRLKAEGRWENTILVIGSDHGYPAGSHRIMPGHPNDAPYIHPFATRVPLLFVWPGHIEGGRRIQTPVSMVDVLPTLLELAGLPQPEAKQGRSLAPLLLGKVAEAEWEPYPVFVDVLVTDSRSGELVGNIEVIDGRWGAALCVRPNDPGEEVSVAAVGDGLTDCTASERDRLLVYDLWDDPLLERPLNEQRPDLVRKYTELLEKQVEINATLRQLIEGGGQSVELLPEQLEQLRTLGYIQ